MIKTTMIKFAIFVTAFSFSALPIQARSEVETYAAMELHLDSWRWAGVPFYVRAGKSLALTATEANAERPEDAMDDGYKKLYFGLLESLGLGPDARLRRKLEDSLARLAAPRLSGK